MELPCASSWCRHVNIERHRGHPDTEATDHLPLELTTRAQVCGRKIRRDDAKCASRFLDGRKSERNGFLVTRARAEQMISATSFSSQGCLESSLCKVDVDIIRIRFSESAPELITWFGVTCILTLTHHVSCVARTAAQRARCAKKKPKHHHAEKHVCTVQRRGQSRRARG